LQQRSEKRQPTMPARRKIAEVTRNPIADYPAGGSRSFCFAGSLGGSPDPGGGGRNAWGGEDGEEGDVGSATWRTCVRVVDLGGTRPGCGPVVLWTYVRKRKPTALYVGRTPPFFWPVGRIPCRCERGLLATEMAHQNIVYIKKTRTTLLCLKTQNI
jgi:hypothetical protein